MAWTIEPYARANHNPVISLNGRTGDEPLQLSARVGEPITLDASATRDPDGQALRYSWFFYPEAGMGIPGHPVAIRTRVPAAVSEPGAGNIPSAPIDGPPQPPPRVTIEGASSARAIVTPRVAGVAHVILAVAGRGGAGAHGVSESDSDDRALGRGV